MISGFAARSLTVLVMTIFVATEVPGIGTRVASRAVDDWTERLEALTPERPADYFLLAEEVAERARDETDLALARRLFSLAAVLDPLQFGQGACLALADLEGMGPERQRFEALATLLAQQRGRPPLVIVDARTDAAAEMSSAMMLGISEALSYYRRGEGARALTVLRSSGALDLLEQRDDVIPGGSNRFLEDCRRFRSGGDRPSLSDSQVIDLLRFEVALLAGQNRSWAGDLLLNGNTPLIEVDPDHLEETLGIDGRRSIYRNGRWIPNADS